MKIKFLKYFILLVAFLSMSVLFLKTSTVFAASGGSNVICSLQVSVNTSGVVAIIGSVHEQSPGTDPSYTTANVYDNAGVGSDSGTGDVDANANYTTHFSDGTYTAYLDGAGLSNPGNTTSNCHQEETFTVSTSNLPDLTAGPTVPNSTPVSGRAITFSSPIINNGATGTGKAFLNLFQVATLPSDSTTVINVSATSLPVLDAGSRVPITHNAYTFSSAGTYYVRTCADENTSMIGSITESNEENNCGAWTSLTVYSPSTSCIEGWSDPILVYDGPVDSGSSWCSSRSEGECSPPPNGSTGGHDPSSKGNTTSCCYASGAYGWERTCGGVPTYCSINSFTPDNSSIPYGGSTNLHFSLSGSFPWTISLLQGSSQPTPVSGISAGGTSATGNLTTTQAYRLTCGDSTRDLVVSVGVVPTYALTVNMAGTGTGVVTGAGLYNYGDVAHLSATAADDSVFLGWGGDCDNSGTVIITAPKTCTATFDLDIQANPMVKVFHSAGGIVKSVAPDYGINCGSVCSKEYKLGGTVNLQAIPNSSYWKFSNWSGDCSGESSSCVLDIDGTKEVTAVFTLRSFKIIEF